MNANWLKPNLYIIENGKLVPRPTTPEQKKKNYRYIPYDPLNNPGPQDYFRETISRLQKQNIALRNQLNQTLLNQSTNGISTTSNIHSSDIYQYQKQIALLKQEVANREEQLRDKNQQLTNKDKQILEMSNENTRLHIRIMSVMKEIESLNQLMFKKDEEILNKKQQIEEYCRTLERLTSKEKQEEKTAFSENHLMTPKIQEKGDEQDEFYSFDNYSLRDRQSIDRRYMTPEIQIRFDDNRQYIYRSEKQPQDYNVRSAENSRIKMADERQNSNSMLGNNLKNWSAWAGQGSNGKLITLDLVRQEIDPIAGSFSSVFPRR